MNSFNNIEPEITPIIQEVVQDKGDSVENGKTNNLFIGDTGELALDTRRALVQMLYGPSLDGRLD